MNFFFLQNSKQLKSIAKYSVLGFRVKTGASGVRFQAVWQNVQHGLDLLPAVGWHLKRNQRRALEKPRCSENVLIFACALKLLENSTSRKTILKLDSRILNPISLAGVTVLVSPRLPETINRDDLAGEPLESAATELKKMEINFLIVNHQSTFAPIKLRTWYLFSSWRFFLLPRNSLQ